MGKIIKAERGGGGGGGKNQTSLKNIHLWIPTFYVVSQNSKIHHEI